MRLTLAWLRLDARRRWRSLLALALLLALAAGTVLTAVAGARRGDTAMQRLLERTAPMTVAALPNDPAFDWAPVRALPEVAALSGFVVAPFFVEEAPGFTGYLPPADADVLRELERPVLLRGRLADPSRLDEVVVTPQFPVSFRAGLGDSVTLHLMTPQQAGDPAFYADPKPAGPRIRARIVGVIRSPWYSDAVGSTGNLVPTPAVYARYRANLIGEPKPFGFVNALIRLRHGEADLPAFRRDLARVSGRSDIDLMNAGNLARHAQKVDAFESGCLLAFGLAALAAAVVLIGQALARYVSASAADLRVLRALGMRRAQGIAATVAGPALAGLAGATLGVLGAVVASRWMPIGVAATLEPSPGLDADLLVLGSGWLAVQLLVAGGVAAMAWRTQGAAAAAAARPSGTVLALARAGLPVPVVVGARFALEPGRGRSAIPVRSALVGAVTGVMGVLAALTFSAGVSDAAAAPQRFGQTFQLDLRLGEAGQDWVPTAAALAVVAREPAVAAVGETRIGVAESGNASITVYSYRAAGPAPLPVVLSAGRLPRDAGELVLGPTTAERLHAAVGSTVPLRGGRPGERTLTVSGIGFVPQGPHNDYDDGAWITPSGYDRLFTGFKYHDALLVLRPGADPAAVQSRLAQASGRAIGTPALAFPPNPPTQLAEIRDVRRLPLVLGLFLALLAVGAVGHALASAVRLRRLDVAVLRALGMTRPQSLGVVLTQATVLAVAGLLLGVPLGVALGRVLWQAVADYTPLEYVPPLALLTLILVAPVALGLANLLAAWPGRQAARLRIAHLLRVE